jgi:light-regulated signal transduction histidine kinase (bacteriophytochrome)
VRVWGAKQDISRIKKVEDEIRLLNIQLEQRVKDRTAELQLAIGELESFSYSVSHDLRAPLRSISGFSNIIKNEYSGSLDPEGIDLFNKVLNSTKRMGELIDDLLRLSRISKQELRKDNVIMKELLKNVFDELTGSSDNSILKLKNNYLCDINADSSLMKIALTNLLSNAIKFSKSRKKPVIEVGCATNENEIIYSIKDNGVGFDMNYADKLFKVFQRLHSIEEFEGTGIGLALVQRIISKHGGKVWAEGEVGKGATFYFTIPT